MKMKMKMKVAQDRQTLTRAKVVTYKAASVAALVLATGAPHKFG